MAEYIDREKIQYREIVDYYDEQNMCEYHCDVADKVKIDRLPIADVIPIPEGATNGDMLKAVFNPVQIIKYTSCVQVYFSDDYYKFFDMYWWNAPYKKGNANG